MPLLVSSNGLTVVVAGHTDPTDGNLRESVDTIRVTDRSQLWKNMLRLVGLTTGPSCLVLSVGDVGLVHMVSYCCISPVPMAAEKSWTCSSPPHGGSPRIPGPKD